MASTTYFNAQQGSTDLRLLPSWMRKHRDVADYSVRMQEEILAQFTFTTYDGPAYGWELVGADWVQTSGPLAGMVKLTDNLYIALRGYNTDPSLADAYFSAAFVREIGSAIVWRMQADRIGLVSGKDADAGVGMAAVRNRLDQPFPPNFPRFLRPFVVEPVTFVI